MPTFEKLDNKGNPTGDKKDFTYDEATKLRRMKNCKWRELPGNKPKVSRTHQVESTEKNLELIKQFPARTGEQLDWVKECSDVELLKSAQQIATKNIVLNAIKRKLEELDKPNT